MWVLWSPLSAVLDFFPYFEETLTYQDQYRIVILKTVAKYNAMHIAKYNAKYKINFNKNILVKTQGGYN